MGRDPDPLFSLRAMVIVLLALLSGVSVGLLTYAADQSVPRAVLAGGAAAAAAVPYFDRIVGRNA